MDSQKKIIIGLGALFILFLILILWIFLFKKPAVNSSTSSQNSIASTFPIIPGEKPSGATDTFDIKTQQGSVAVNNVYKLPAVQPLSENGVNFKNSQYYYMAYYPNQQGFLIVMQDPDIQTARQIAEDDFLKTLNITKNQACQLNVSLTVPTSISQLAGGGNYRLSFCSNGKPFPK